MEVSQQLLRLPFNQIFSARRGGRLVRDYFFFSAILISGGLITSGLLEIYLRYYENRGHVALMQRDVADRAAFRIGLFIKKIEDHMKAAGMSSDIASKGLSPEYKTELRKLLSIAPLAVVPFGPGIHRALWQAALCERSSVAEPTRRKGDRRDSYLAGKICAGRTAPEAYSNLDSTSDYAEKTFDVSGFKDIQVFIRVAEDDGKPAFLCWMIFL